MIANTITTDLQKATVAANDKEKQLRAERLRLIKEKIMAAGGKDKDITVANGKCTKKLSDTKET